MVQVPTDKKLSAPPLLTVQIFAVPVVKVAARPESAVAVKVGVVPKSCVPGLANVMTWAAVGVTALDGVDAGPAPTLLLAVTVNS